jgi:lipopolysaccharide export LptBFGC system permease protein LptF
MDPMENFTFFLDTANSILVLLTGLLGLIGTGAGVFFAIKNWVANIKTKNSQEIWFMLMEMADAAMTEAEQSKASGEDKKTMVIDIIQASAKASNLNIDEFADQLDLYIDQTIAFVNKMQKKN